MVPCAYVSQCEIPDDIALNPARWEAASDVYLGEMTKAMEGLGADPSGALYAVIRHADRNLVVVLAPVATQPKSNEEVH